MIGWLFVPGTPCCGEQFPQMTRQLEAQWAVEEEAARRIREDERDAREQEERDLFAARNRVTECETHTIDELIDPTRPWGPP